MLKSALLNLVNWREARALQSCFSPLLDTLKLTLVDVGAAGDIEPRWRRIAPLINYVGFEPDKRSFMQLKDKRTDCADYKIHNAAVWSSNGVLDYNLCKGWQVSSHYKPNVELVSLFPNSERFDVEKSLKIPTYQLDEIVDGDVDFLKIDTQGGELEILKGGTELLDSAIGFELEVSFASLYLDQPLFHHLAEFALDRGFEFIDFVSLRRWERQDNQSGRGQMIFGDGLFLRTPEAIAKLATSNPDKIRKYIVICGLYNRLDLIDRLVELCGDDHDWLAKTAELAPIRRRARRSHKINKIAQLSLRMVGSEFKTHNLF